MINQEEMTRQDIRINWQAERKMWYSGRAFLQRLVIHINNMNEKGMITDDKQQI